MAKLLAKTSKTFGEFLLIPGLTTKACRPEAVDLATPLVKFRKSESPALKLNIPFTSAIMQAVSDHHLAIALAQSGGLSFIYTSQSIANQAEMVRQVKKFKAGFVESDSNLLIDQTIADVLALKEKTGHTTMAVTDDGSAHGQLLGILGSRDYRPDKIDHQLKVGEVMTPREKLICGDEGLSLEEANDLIWQHKLNALPIVDKNNKLLSLVFRKDYDAHHEYQKELIDANKQLLVGAGINTHDYQERVPALLEAGADVLCLDSSDGYNEWQGEAIKLIKKDYPKAKVGAGNVVDGDGFRYLAEAGADFVKVGIGGGSICITREQKGIGRGQASAVIAVAKARDDYFRQTGIYIPICSDGGVVQDYHIALALAMGADWVMLGRYFARFDESPSAKIKINGNYVKEYWGEGSERARNWQRYSDHSQLASKSAFAEGVDAYVPYAGKLEDNLNIALAKIKSTMISCGATSIKEFQQRAKITEVSPTSFRENGAHDVITRDNQDLN
jgi:IMP dehydrogenase